MISPYDISHTYLDISKKNSKTRRFYGLPVASRHVNTSIYFALSGEA